MNTVADLVSASSASFWIDVLAGRMPRAMREVRVRGRRRSCCIAVSVFCDGVTGEGRGRGRTSIPTPSLSALLLVAVRVDFGCGVVGSGAAERTDVSPLWKVVEVGETRGALSLAVAEAVLFRGMFEREDVEEGDRVCVDLR